MLHSVSALPVQARGMRQVVTSYLYSVTRGKISGMEEAKKLGASLMLGLGLILKKQKHRSVKSSYSSSSHIDEVISEKTIKGDEHKSKKQIVKWKS